jgi:hypothetical protein
MNLETMFLYASLHCEHRSVDRGLTAKARREFKDAAHHLHNLRKLAIENQIYLGSRDPKNVESSVTLVPRGTNPSKGK